MGGYAPNAHLMYIHLDPDCADLAPRLEVEIKSTPAHELHHCARWAARGYGTTLLEAVISEGLADHFDIEINGGEPKPWSIALRGAELANIQVKAQEEYTNETYNHGEWFYGTGSIPRWAGYALGYALVDTHIEKTGKKASALVGEDARLFVV